MIPLRDRNPVQRTPVVTWTIVAVCVAVWAAGFVYEGGPDGLVRDLGLVPAKLFGAPGASTFATVLTSGFAHAGLLHLASNLWFLHVFGDNVEDHLGHGRYALLYLGSMLGAAATHVAIDPSSVRVLVGASGAIAGVLGAYMLRYPRAPIVTFAFVALLEMPAFLFLAQWVALQIVIALLTDAGRSGGVAVGAHLGGFASGVLLELVLGRSGHGSVRDR